jgi:hypothetical protein
MARTLTPTTRDARIELQAWYLGGLLPKLERARRAGALEPRELEAFDDDMRGLLDLARRDHIDERRDG